MEPLKRKKGIIKGEIGKLERKLVKHMIRQNDFSGFSEMKDLWYNKNRPLKKYDYRYGLHNDKDRNVRAVEKSTSGYKFFNETYFAQDQDLAKYLKSESCLKIRLSKRLYRKIVNGANIKSILIMPPQLPSLNIHYNISLEGAEEIIIPQSEEFHNNLIFEDFHGFSVEGKNIYCGIDLNQIAGERPLSFGFINFNGVAKKDLKQLEWIQKNANPIEPSPIANVAKVKISNLGGFKDDIRRLAGISNIVDPNSNKSPWDIFWKKVEVTVLQNLTRPSSDNPYKLSKKRYDDDGKDKNELTFNDYLMAPAFYWAIKRQHLSDHLPALHKTKSHLKKWISEENSHSRVLKLHYEKIKRDIRTLNRKTELIRIQIIRYLARCIYYIIKVLKGKLKGIVFEHNFASSEGKTGYLAGIIQSMVKNVENLIFSSKKMTPSLNYLTVMEMVRQDPKLDIDTKKFFIKVSSRNTSARHIDCLLRAFSFRIIPTLESQLQDKKIDMMKTMEDSKGDYGALIENYKKWMDVHYNDEEAREIKWFKEKKITPFFKEYLIHTLFKEKGIPIDAEQCLSDRSGGADWALCHTCQFMKKVEQLRNDENTKLDAPVIFESHDSAGCVIALKGAVKRDLEKNRIDYKSFITKNTPYTESFSIS